MLTFALPQRHRARLPLSVFLLFASTLLVWHLWSLPGADTEVIHVQIQTGPPPGAPAVPVPQQHVPSPPTDSTSATSATLTPIPEQNDVSFAPILHDECQPVPGLEDIMVVLKTGATEIQDKLPVHFNTTLKCVPHFAIMSDVAEEFNGHQVHDVLSGVSDEIVKDIEEFALYRKMREYRENNLNFSELVQTPEQTKVAWNLDKWKFLPMVTKAYSLRNDAKWYVFVEADTYILYSNLLMWLQHMRSEQMLYIGGQSWIGDQVFAHGGTGFVISNPAMKKLTELIAIHKKEMERMTRDEWAGDLVLAKALKAVGVTLTQSWPIFQGETPATLDYTERHYCYPVVSYHHVDTDWIKFLWDFEQAWIAHNRQEDTRVPVRHRDAFEHFVNPYLNGELQNWDNISNDEEVKLSSDTVNACRKACSKVKECVQWRYIPGGTCKLGKVIRLGKKESDENILSTSGWMTDRVQKFKKKMEPCQQEWIVS